MDNAVKKESVEVLTHGNFVLLSIFKQWKYYHLCLGSFIGGPNYIQIQTKLTAGLEQPALPSSPPISNYAGAFNIYHEYT